MFVRKSELWNAARCFSVAGAISVVGCGVSLAPDGSSGPRTTLGSSVVPDPTGPAFQEGPSNGAFDEAELVDVAEQSRLIQGRIAGSDDVDIYDLGFVSPGDRIIVTMSADLTLDGALALFDEDGAALLVNDNRNVYLGRREPFIDVVASRFSSSCYVAVSATPTLDDVGDYTLVASKQPDSPVSEGRSSTVLLVFSGGDDVRIGRRPAVDVQPFDAEGIHPSFADQTDQMVAELVAMVREDYEAYDINILSTSEGDRFDGSMSRVFFGTFDPGLLGVAEGVDEFDADQQQEAIIFTDTFAAFSQIEPTVLQMAQALANVTSHEIGHLLGLVHTRDTLGIMDITASLRGLTADQAFRASPLHETVFPIGDQDSIDLLLGTLGGDAELADLKRAASEERSKVIFDSAGLPDRSDFHLSTCGL